jgi:hypothetical protein
MLILIDFNLQLEFLKRIYEISLIAKDIMLMECQKDVFNKSKD